MHKWLGKRRFVCWLWSRVYRRWLYSTDRVDCVLGWRTARVITRTGQPICMTPIFWWFE